MKWWSVLKRGGRYVSKKKLEELRGCLEELDGSELPARMSEVKFIVSTGLPSNKVARSEACQGMRTNARKALARKNVFIGEW
jgi:hypothetical protein